MRTSIRRIKKVIKYCSTTLERQILIPLKIKFSSRESAIITEFIYHGNNHGFNSCVLFCHYNEHGLILDQVKELCLFFQLQGIDVIFLTTKLSDESKEWVEKNLSALIIRRNIGRDFGAWKDGIAFLNKQSLFSSCSQLYLINDSVVLLGDNLKSTRFQSQFIDDTKTDMIGLTESWQIAYHLQSYFLKFNKTVLQSKLFLKYWHDYPIINSRLFSIEKGEIGLSQLLLNNGYQLKSVYPIMELVAKENIESFFISLSGIPNQCLIELIPQLFNEFFQVNFHEMNPSHRLWPLLLVAGCPVLKRDLIQKNTENLISMHYCMCIFTKCIKNSKAKEIFLQSLSHL
ncbi:rhamnan synthesis F family protein [Cylindrospermopsis raciborskii]|uniref:rhamnan synthesis F family protein n=1 Tax=Cylindrospermopsis raciborskii TaxID=77022 RepID=UPI00387971A3